MNIETFLFGVSTGVAMAAAFQYLLVKVPHIIQSATQEPHRNHSKQSVSSHPHQDLIVTTNNSELFMSPPSRPSTPTPNSVLAKLDEQLVMTSSRLQKIVLHMVSEFKKGLQNEGEMIKMLPSYVVNRPTGEETGVYLALDLGGTNFRVCRVNLEGYGNIRTSQAKYTISDELKQGPGHQLFDFLADCVSTFCRDQSIPLDSSIGLGFTFSFPVEQTSIHSGWLIKWSKAFTCDGVVGKDVVGLLQESMEKKGLKIKVKALVNDTVGTLIAHAYTDPQTYLAVILGTGTNAAYVEKIPNIQKWGKGDGDVVINTEWGAYNEPSILSLSDYDRLLDRRSNNPGQQVFEKLISGMYLGEIVRLILLDLIKSGELFGGKGSKELEKEYFFDTANMSRIERDHSLSLSDTKQLLEDVFAVPTTTVDDRRIVKHVCELVGTRAARLSAAGIAALVTKMNRLDACTVAIDGSLFEHYPHFGNRMRDALREILGLSAQNIVLEQARDGSGQGAALIAALA